MLAQIPVEEPVPTDLTPDQKHLLETMGVTDWKVSQNEEGQTVLTYTHPETQPKTPLWLILFCAFALVFSGIAIGNAMAAPQNPTITHRC